jgi:hypothetical protein
MQRMGIADHREQRVRLGLAIDHEAAAEDLVPAVLAVRLREHHQLDVGRIAFERAKALLEVGDLVVCQRQAKLAVRALERRAPGTQQVDAGERPRPGAPEQLLGVTPVFEHALGHPIVQPLRDPRELGR